MKVSVIVVQLSSGAIAITSFNFSRAWGCSGDQKPPGIAEVKSGCHKASGY